MQPSRKPKPSTSDLMDAIAIIKIILLTIFFLVVVPFNLRRHR